MHMTREAITVGERVRDGLGHWYEVVEIVGDGRYGRARVQPLTPCGTQYVPLGAPVWAFRGDLRKDGE
jgi:hypothetical protein